MQKKVMDRFCNRLKLASHYALHEHGSSLFPQEAAIEITNYCNLSCVMCPHKKMTRKKGTMELSLFQNIVDDLKGRCEFLYLYGTGESLLCKNFFQYAEYAVKSGMTTCLSTNATMINEEIAENLIDSGIDFIVVAIDGATEETYNGIRVGADFQKVIEKCKMLLQAKLRKKTKTDINIQFIYMENNAREAKALESYFSSEEKRAINQFRIKPYFDSYPNSLENIRHTCACYFLWNFISITWDGKVQICCMDYDANHVLGDLSEQSVEAIWNGPALKDLRHKHRELKFDELDLCKSCTLPEKKYFSNWTVLGSTLVDAWHLRKLIPYYEKIWLLKNHRR